jgi:phage replication-related protein YjqB (UPF0714/DUF867 family)
MPVGLVFEKPADTVSVGSPAQFSVHTRINSLRAAVFAQYGGLSEPGTDICAAQIAGETLSLHTVVSCRAIWEADNGENRLVPRPLHNHPDGIALAESCQTVISVRGRHACHDPSGEVCVDGLDIALIVSLAETLAAAGFVVNEGQSQSRAKHPDNICNRGIRMRGVELDISHELMSRLLNDADTMARFATGVRTGLQPILAEC